MDIVGMQDAVRRSKAEPELACRLENMLSSIQRRCVELTKRWDEQYPIRARAFSDSVVLTCPVASDYSLRKVAVYVSAYQVEAADYGYFMRGAVAAGPHCDREDVCFGPALVEAYHAEEQIARWPRVIVLPSALALRSEGRHPYLRRDEAGVTYVDYLHLFVVNAVIQSRTPESRRAGLHPYSWIAVVEKHKTALESAVETLDADSPQFLITLSKYHSLVHYHNRYLGQYLRGGQHFPLTQLLELILSSQKGLTEDDLNRQVSEITRAFSEKDEQVRACIIDVGKMFAPLRSPRAKRRQ